MTTEYLQWCISWTRAFPCISFHWLRLSNNVDIHKDDDDKEIITNEDYLWLSYIAFHCIWNETSYSRNLSLSRQVNGNNKVSTTTTTNTNHDENMTKWKNSLGYGEITEMAVLQIVHELNTMRSVRDEHHHSRNHHHHRHKIGTTMMMMDLGSGTGRVVLAAALAASWMASSSSPQRLVLRGMEIVPHLHDAAMHVVSLWNQQQQEFESTTTTSSFVEGITQLNVQCGDFLQQPMDPTTGSSSSWLSQVDVIFIHGTVFEDALWEQLDRMIVPNENDATTDDEKGGVRVGTWIVSVSRPLSGHSPPQLQCHDDAARSSSCSTGSDSHVTGIDTGRPIQPHEDEDDDDRRCHCGRRNGRTCRYLQNVSEFDVEMSWGRGMVYLQRVSSMP